MTQSESKFYGKAFEYALSGGDFVDFDPRFARIHNVDVQAESFIYLSTQSYMPDGFWFIFHSLNHSAASVFLDGDEYIAGATILCLFANGVWSFRNINFGISWALPFLHAKVAVVGGTGTSTSSVFYTPSSNTWASGPNPATAKIESAGAMFGDKGNFVGSDPLAGSVSEKNDEISIRLSTFTNRTDYPEQVMRGVMARGSNASQVDALFFYGGDSNFNVRSYVFNAWTTQTSLPIKRSRGTASSVARQDRLERCVFLMNGGDPTGQPVLGHNPRADFYWTATLQAGPSRRSVAGFTRAGRVHQVGGYLDSPLTRYDLNEEYNPQTDTWTTRTALGLGIRYGGAGASGTARGFYCGGNTSSDVASSAASSYLRDTWTGIASMPAARSEVRASGVSL